MSAGSPTPPGDPKHSVAPVRVRLVAALRGEAPPGRSAIEPVVARGAAALEPADAD
jgi:hypothetical protein